MKLDSAVPLWSYDTGTGTSGGNSYLPAGTPTTGIATAARDQAYDVAGWDSWTMFVRSVAFPGAGPFELQLDYFDNITGDAGVFGLQRVALPSAAQIAIGAAQMISGRLLGPALAVQTIGSNWQGRIDLLVHNRTRRYDAPYTPELLGTILAGIDTQNVGANASLTQDLPYYLGPVRLNGFWDTGASTRVRIADDTGNELATLTGDSAHQAQLWIPNLDIAATKWQLIVSNRAGATASLGATVIAA